MPDNDLKIDYLGICEAAWACQRECRSCKQRGLSTGGRTQAISANPNYARISNARPFLAQP